MAPSPHDGVTVTNRISAELLITAGVDGMQHLDRLIERIGEAGGETGQLTDAAAQLRQEWDSLSADDQAKRLHDLAEAANQAANDVGIIGQRAREAGEELDDLSKAKITLGLDNDEKIKQQIEEVNAAFRLLQEQGGLTHEELMRAADHHRARLQELEAELSRIGPELDDLSKAKITLGIDNDDNVRKQIEEVTEAYKLLREEGNLSHEELARATQVHRARVEELEAQLGRVRPSLEDIAAGVGKMVGAFAGLTSIAKDAMEFETAMAGVKKVVDGTPEQMASLAGQVKNLAYELGMVPEAVAEIAAQGGQLGVAFADLPEFTRLAGQMSVAFGMTAGQAAEAAAKISNVFGISLAEMRQLGDAINVLGNNTAAKEAEISEALLRIGGTAKQFGLAAEQAAALADAFIALGKSPEVAGTAINALLTKLQTAPAQGKEFQDALKSIGMEAKQLAKDIHDNPEQALLSFLSKLETLDKQQRAIVLTKLFGAEYADDISLAAGSLDTLRQAFGLVADKTETAGAMQKEFEAAMSTTGAKVEQAKIAIGNIAKTLGAQLLPIIGAVADGIGGAANAINDFAERYPLITELATYMAGAKLAAVGLGGAMDVLGVSMEDMTTYAVNGFGRFKEAVSSGAGALGGLKAVLAGMGQLWVTAGLTAAVALYEALKSNVDEVNKAQHEAMQTWADAGIAQQQLNMALAAGSDVLGDYVQKQQAALKAELAAIDQRIASYKAQQKAAEERFFTDEKTVVAAKKAIAAEEDRRTSIQQTVDATQKLIDKAQEEARTQAEAAAKKKANIDAWEMLTGKVEENEKALEEITKKSDTLTAALDTIVKNVDAAGGSFDKAGGSLQAVGQEAASAANTLRLAFTQGIDAAETVETLDAIRQRISDLASEGKISQGQMQALFADIDARAKVLPSTLDGSAQALKTLGLEAGQLQTGISKNAAEAISSFTVAANRFGTDTEKMATLYKAAMAKMASGEEQAALLKALERVGSQAGMTAKDIKRIGDSAPQAASKVAEAFAKINVDVDAVNQGISKGAKEAFMDFSRASTLAAESAQNSSKLIRASFDEIAGGLKSKEEFAAFNATLRETGDLGKLGGERMQILRAGMQGGAEAAEKMRESLAANTEARKQNNEATGKAAEDTKADRDAKAGNTAAIEDNTAAIKENAEAKGEDAAATKNSADEAEKAGKSLAFMYDASKLNTEQMNLLDDALNRMGSTLRLGTEGAIAQWFGQQRAAAQYIEEVQRANSALDNLTQKTSDGTVSMQDIAEATHAATTRIAQLDSTTLNNLHAAIDEARQKLKELEEQAKDSADSLEAELAQLRGDDSKTAALEQERKIRELNAKLHEAEIRRNSEEIAQYRRAIELQRQIGDEKARQAAAKKAEEQQQRQQQQQQQTSGNNGRGNSSSGNSRGNGRGYTAAEVADVFDARIAQSRREGRDDFARELHDEMKRRT